MAMDSEFQWVDYYASSVATKLGRYTSDEVWEALMDLAPIVVDLCGLAACDSDQLATRVNVQAWARVIEESVEYEGDADLSEVLADLLVHGDGVRFVYPGSEFSAVVEGGAAPMIAVPAALYGEVVAGLITAEQMLRTWQQPSLFDLPVERAGVDFRALQLEISESRRIMYAAGATVEFSPANSWPILTVGLSESALRRAEDVLMKFVGSRVMDAMMESRTLKSIPKVNLESAIDSMSAMLSSSISNGHLNREVVFDG